jgi:glutaredoxin-like protein
MHLHNISWRASLAAAPQREKDSTMSESDPAITVYGAYWCPDCRRAKQFLGEHQIPYNWIDIEQDAAAEQFVIEKNGGKRIIPTIVFDDGTVLVEPSNAELAAKLALSTSLERKHFPLIVIGGGPAGLTTALYTACTMVTGRRGSTAVNLPPWRQACPASLPPAMCATVAPSRVPAPLVKAPPLPC